MESNTKYGDSIYFHCGETLYVNLFIASVLNWAARGITVRQETSFPEAATTRLTVTGSGTFTLKLRIPSWTSGPQVRINGVLQTATLTPGSDATITRAWASGDVVDLSVPMPVVRESTPDSATTQAVTVGPIVLAAAYGTNNLSSLPTLTPASLTATATPLQYTATASTGAVTLLPFYKMHGHSLRIFSRVLTASEVSSFFSSGQ